MSHIEAIVGAVKGNKALIQVLLSAPLVREAQNKSWKTFVSTVIDWEDERRALKEISRIAERAWCQDSHGGGRSTNLILPFLKEEVDEVVKGLLSLQKEQEKNKIREKALARMSELVEPLVQEFGPLGVPLWSDGGEPSIFDFSGSYGFLTSALRVRYGDNPPKKSSNYLLKEFTENTPTVILDLDSARPIWQEQTKVEHQRHRLYAQAIKAHASFVEAMNKMEFKRLGHSYSRSAYNIVRAPSRAGHEIARIKVESGKEEKVFLWSDLGLAEFKAFLKATVQEVRAELKAQASKRRNHIVQLASDSGWVLGQHEVNEVSPSWGDTSDGGHYSDEPNWESTVSFETIKAFVRRDLVGTVPDFSLVYTTKGIVAVNDEEWRFLQRVVRLENTLLIEWMTALNKRESENKKALSLANELHVNPTDATERSLLIKDRLAEGWVYMKTNSSGLVSESTLHWRDDHALVEAVEKREGYWYATRWLKLTQEEYDTLPQNRMKKADAKKAKVLHNEYLDLRRESWFAFVPQEVRDTSEAQFEKVRTFLGRYEFEFNSLLDSETWLKEAEFLLELALCYAPEAQQSHDAQVAREVKAAQDEYERYAYILEPAGRDDPAYAREVIEGVSELAGVYDLHFILHTLEATYDVSYGRGGVQLDIKRAMPELENGLWARCIVNTNKASTMWMHIATVLAEVESRLGIESDRDEECLEKDDYDAYLETQETEFVSKGTVPSGRVATFNDEGDRYFKCGACGSQNRISKGDNRLYQGGEVILIECFSCQASGEAKKV